MKLRVLGVIVSLAATQAALAWNELGHMVAASIAYKRLSPSVRSECDRLLLIGGNGKAQTFIDAGPWADDVRRERPETAPWHYINYHFRTDGKPTDQQPEPENVEVAIAKQVDILKDKLQTDAVRADALRFIIHFVGDAHQPLHAVARDTDAYPTGDRGGNSFTITPPEGLVPQPKNLHFLWDEGCGLFAGKRASRPLTESKTAEVTAFGDQLLTNYGSIVASQARDLDPHTWTQEGLALAKAQVYNLKEGGAPDEQYLKQGRETSGKRIVLAGLRLSSLLNKALG